MNQIVHESERVASPRPREARVTVTAVAGAARIEHWRQRLPEGERKTLDVLIAADGGEVERGTIDDRTGYKRSSRDAYLTRLKARGLVEFVGPGLVRASAELFD